MALQFNESIDALTLSRREFPPIQWIIPDVIPSGATLLAAPEKVGKSWWALQIARAVSLRGSVLYLALEDTQESLHWRMGMQPGVCLSTLTLVPQGGALPLPHGVTQIAHWLDLRPDPKLVIVDTFEKLRGDDGNGRQYRSDYKAVAALKALADKHSIALLFLHHLNQNEAKGDEAPGDPVYRVSGTSGLTGAADTVLILQRPRLEATGHLFVTGRRVPTSERFVDWDAATFRWSLDVPPSPYDSPVLNLLGADGRMTRAEVCRELGGDMAQALGRIEDALALGLLAEDSEGALSAAPALHNPPTPNSGTGSALAAVREGVDECGEVVPIDGGRATGT